MNDTELLHTLADRQAITDLIYTYCRSMDRIDAALGHTIFHPDGTADYGADVFQGSGTGAIDAICEQHRHCTVHSHQITNILITLNGDHAGSEAYHVAAVRMLMDGKLMQVTTWGRYLDTWSRRAGRWGIDHRLVIRDLDEITEVTPLSTIERGRRDRTCPSYAILA